MLLLRGWKEQGLWFVTCAFLGEGKREEHRFWCKVAEVEADTLGLAGEHALLELPIDAETAFEYAEVSEVPNHLRMHFSAFGFCLAIRSKSVIALLFGQGPKSESK